MIRGTTFGAVGMGIIATVNNWSMALFDEPATVIMMAGAGSLLSFAYANEDEKALPKKKMYFLALANTAFAVAVVAIAPELFGWHWISPKVEGSTALIFAAGARFVIPIILKMIPELARKWLRIGEYKTTGNTEKEIPLHTESKEIHEQEQPAAITPKRRVKKDAPE